MIVRPYLTVGNQAIYSPAGREDIQITVTVRQVVRKGQWAIVAYRDGAKRLCRAEQLHPMPEARMKPVVSIRQVVEEYEAMDGDVSSYERLKKKHGLR